MNFPALDFPRSNIKKAGISKKKFSFSTLSYITLESSYMTKITSMVIIQKRNSKYYAFSLISDNDHPNPIGIYSIPKGHLWNALLICFWQLTFTNWLEQYVFLVKLHIVRYSYDFICVTIVYQRIDNIFYLSVLVYV